MSGSSTTSSDTSMTGQVPSEEEAIASAGIADVSIVDHENVNPPAGRPIDAQAVQTPVSPESDFLLDFAEASSNNYIPPQDRKRRLTSNSDASRLQRTCSGGAIRPEASAMAALPHRSVSMVVPASRGTSSRAPGSSYATAIDITSSPPDDGRYSAIDRADTGHRPYAEGSSFWGSSNHVHAGENEAHPSRVNSRWQPDPTPGASSHISLSSGSSSVSRTHEGPSDRPGYQTWHPGSAPGVDGDALANSKNTGRRRLIWDCPPRRSSLGSSGSARGSSIEENSHPGLAVQHATSRFLNRAPVTSRSTTVSIPGTEGDIYRTHTRANTLNSSGFTDNGERTIESFGWRPERRAVDRTSSEGWVFSASSGEASRSRADNADERYGRYPEYQDVDMPRWQPDAEVTSCPICGTVFSFWYRKHHCRKCGRVVCASCSPHSIVIPRQFIVRPPDTPTSQSESSPASQTPVVDLTGDDPDPFNSSINPALGGGEKVRLCNPCVPDPNPNPLGYGSPRGHGHRSTHSLTSSMGQNNSRGAIAPSRQERRTVGANDRPAGLQGLGRPARRSISGTMDSFSPSTGDRSRMAGTTFAVDLSAAAPPPRPQVSEEDLCPVCGRQFPALSNEHTQDAREGHIRECIAGYGASPVHAEPEHVDLRQPPPSLRPSPVTARMLPFTATEKDCLAEEGTVAECQICFEEYEVGQSLARLNCFCKFHKACILDWFSRRMTCPTHQG
ncbi:hypothetical protein PEBR_22667 [Penicillium brasilianum]|uniref:RING-type E3 ubiquitin transferase n=1 Tax=Penicillium brasilianum TaxID=104259 RepID=A0A1S9RKX3_PENBI|nr:hypothetical protein PEBR_22667 [Penicillium brasilianum]